ncbi:anti-sigma factor domain-containing protein [Robertmurraya andreesenii]|uniref:RsgI N-terminal anti-sigma domain-containing protein n=1 Tax=Anoxybacillus andreesenii TaxID=1325932 RepID=A0ABT9UZE1_9BACL|nr:anti-sigma factor domain-containing protein [Robertmurraya andreesenii]MDQ0154071.1 hypothetical protein [Robertmurraya andreesenii]
MIKGIIMEMNERFLTLLTPDGEFLQVRKKSNDYQIGQEILVPVEDRGTFFSNVKVWKGKSVVAFAIACILALVTFIPIGKDEVYAYMSIDVNPSIELGVNEDLAVIELISYNDSGKKIIADLPKWRNKDIHEVTGYILKSLKTNGYLKGEQEVIVGTVHTGGINEKSDLKLEAAIGEMKEAVTKDKGELITFEATKKERQTALEAGVSTGKLMAEQQKGKLEQIESTRKNKEDSRQKESRTVQQKPVIEKNTKKEQTPNNNGKAKKEKINKNKAPHDKIDHNPSKNNKNESRRDQRPGQEDKLKEEKAGKNQGNSDQYKNKNQKHNWDKNPSRNKNQSNHNGKSNSKGKKDEKPNRANDAKKEKENWK